MQLKIEKGKKKKKKKLEAGAETDKGDESMGNVDRRGTEHESGVAPKTPLFTSEKTHVNKCRRRHRRSYIPLPDKNDSHPIVSPGNDCEKKCSAAAAAAFPLIGKCHLCCHNVL